MSSGNDRQQVVRSLALAGMVSQIGCVTVIIVIAALLAGLWIDKTLDTRPLFTVGLLLLSVPVTLIILVRIALSTAAQFGVSPPKTAKVPPSEEE